MKNIFFKQVLLIALIAILPAIALAQKTEIPEKPKKGAVVDPTGMLKKEEINYLDSVSKALHKSRNCKSYIVIVDSFAGYTNLKTFSAAIFEKWQLNNDSSLNYIIVYVKKLNGVNIQASTELLKITNLEYLKMVTERSMRPLFIQRKRFEALKKGNHMMVLKIDSN